MKEKEQKRAAMLRRQGMSVNQIEKELGVSRSTVSRWVRNISLTEEQAAVLKANSCKSIANATAFHVQRASKNKSLSLDKGRNRCEHDIDFRTICALYWGEGKKCSPDVVLSNSDASMLQVFVRWIKACEYDFSVRIQYHDNNGLSYDSIRLWWEEKLNVAQDQFKKPTICTVNRASQRKKMGRLLYGTASVRVNKSTCLFWEIMGGIDYIKKS